MVLSRSLIRFGAQTAESNARRYDAPPSRVPTTYDAPSARPAPRGERAAARGTGYRAPAARQSDGYTTPTAPMHRERGA